MKSFLNNTIRDKDSVILRKLQNELTISHLISKIRIGLCLFALVIIFISISSISVFSQGTVYVNSGLNVTTTPPNISALVDMDATMLGNTTHPGNVGLLIPRVGLSGTNDILTVVGTPYPKSLLVYNTATISDVTPGFYYWNGIKWVRFVTSSGTGQDPWWITGNTNTPPFFDNVNNLIGTLAGTNMPLNFRVNGQRSGRIELDPQTANTYLGFQTGNANTAIGVNNTAVGYKALSSNSENFNTAIGKSALTTNTLGRYNTAIGNLALTNNIDGTDNTATGDESLRQNQKGNRNTANGVAALVQNTTGNENTALGNVSMRYNTTGSQNTATGDSSLYSNTTGLINVANGQSALYNNTTGRANVAIGSYSLYNSKTINSTIAIGDSALFSNGIGANPASYEAKANTAIGNLAMYQNTIGYYNTAVGDYSLPGNTTGYLNTTIGVSAMDDNTTGSFNTSAGVAVMERVKTGSGNVAMGYYALGGYNVAPGSIPWPWASPTEPAQVNPNITDDASRNTALGMFSLYQAIGNDNIGIGFESGSNISTGNNIICIGSGLAGVNVPDNRTYIANIYNTPVNAGVNGGAAAVLQVVINSDGQLGTSSSVGGGNAWLITGGPGTLPDYTNNLLGTLTGTNAPLNFIVNGSKSGRLEFSPNTANTFFGFKSGNVTTGGFNTAIGYQSLSNGSGGNYNTSSGYQSLMANTADNNVASGYESLWKNTSGQSNVATGSFSLNSNIGGSNNTATGHQSLYSNNDGNFNTATGVQSLFNNTTGINNVANGYQSLYTNKIGKSNTAVGMSALYYSTGDSNIAIGVNSGSGVTSATNVICIGANLPGANTAFRTYVANIWPTQNTTLSPLQVFVNSAGMLGVQTSSRRFKKDIEDMGIKSTDLYKLRPVIFRYKEEFADGDNSLQYGLIAEEVEKVAPDLVAYDNNGVIYSVKYQLLPPLMLNELQKEHKLNLEQNETIQSMQKQISDLKAQNVKLSTENASVKTSLVNVETKLQTLSSKVDALVNNKLSAK